MTRTAIILLAALAAAASTARTETQAPLEGLSWLKNMPKPEPWFDLPEQRSSEPGKPEKPQGWLKDLSSAVTPEQALRQILPPAEYDNRLYKGNLTITRVATEKEVRKLCPATSYPFKLGCAHHDGPKTKDGAWTNCRVIIVAEDVIAKAKLTVEAVYQHELAHCNGWGPDHWGARFLGEYAHLPASVRRGLGVE